MDIDTSSEVEWCHWERLEQILGKIRTDDNLQERKDKETEQKNEKNLQVGYRRRSYSIS